MRTSTESPIVFIQQLGRGLRKAEGKEYVVILDFIGNYKNNFMIPIALSGDRRERELSPGRLQYILMKYQRSAFFRRLILQISAI